MAEPRQGGSGDTPAGHSPEVPKERPPDPARLNPMAYREPLPPLLGPGPVEPGWKQPALKRPPPQPPVRPVQDRG